MTKRLLQRSLHWLLHITFITGMFAFFGKSRNHMQMGKTIVSDVNIGSISAQTLSDYFIHVDSQILSVECKEILTSLADAAIDIQRIISVLSLTNFNVINKENSINSSGDEQKTIDVVANDIIKSKLSVLSGIEALISEEDENPTPIQISKLRKNRYMVSFDPLDGSSNVECAIPSGTIFALYKYINDSSLSTYNLSSLTGQNIVAAGYVLYSASTEMVIAIEGQINQFTLSPIDRKWYLSRSNIRIPDRGPYYSLNEARYSDWPSGLQRYINDIKDGKSQWKKRYSSRYVCSLVADVHRTLLYGGWAGNPRKHLRLLYEAAPLAFVMKQAGGLGSDGVQSILDIVPEKIHHRLPVFLGSKLDILEIESYGDVQQLSPIKYDA